MHEKHEQKHVLFVPFVFFVDNAFGRFNIVNHLSKSLFAKGGSGTTPLRCIALNVAPLRESRNPCHWHDQTVWRGRKKKVSRNGATTQRKKIRSQNATSDF